MGFINFNKVNPYKLEFVYPRLFYKYNDEPWIKEVLDRLNDTTKLVSNNPYTAFKPVKEDTANGI